MKRLFVFPIIALLFAACGEMPKHETAPPPVTAEPPGPAPFTGVPFDLTVTQAANQPLTGHGFHSSAVGRVGDKWLVIGGRINGFHTMFGPEKQFPIKKANAQMMVVDYGSNTLTTLAAPATYARQLSATNCEYTQEGDLLYFVGGYGSKSTTGQSNYTFPRLLAINVPNMIAAIEAQDETAALAAIEFTVDDERLAVTGGELEKLGDNFYLTVGQNYPRAYDGQNGEYTNKITRFTIDATTKTMANVQEISDGVAGDASEYHRRDLNVVMQHHAAQDYFTVFSGVFTAKQGAWPNPMVVTETNGITSVNIDKAFTQKANLYEAACVLTYDPTTDVMFTSVLGGISNYFYDSKKDTIVPSDTLDFTERLPFVRLINTIAHEPNGTFSEYIQLPPAMLPTYLGADGKFFPLESLLLDGSDEIIDLSKVETTGSSMIGYFFGGIKSSGPQSGNGATSVANDVVYEVHLNRRETY